MSRDQMLERIRAAIAGAPAGALPEVPAPQIFADPVGLFIERARQVGMLAEPVASIGDAADRAAAWCAERRVRRATVWNTADLRPVIDRVRAAGTEILPPGAPPDVLASADIGITGAEWGIAETATLVLPTDADRPRLTSLLPSAHLAVIRADRILPDLPAFFARCGPLPSALTLITGPSRSADIGFVPVLGAHGPMAVAVFVIAN